MSAGNNSWIASTSGDDERDAGDLQPPSAEQPPERAVPGWLSPPEPATRPEPVREPEQQPKADAEEPPEAAPVESPQPAPVTQSALEQEAAEEPAATEPSAPAEPDEYVDDSGYLVPEPREIELPPEDRSRWWTWALAALAIVVAAGAVGYVWWYRTARPITVPDISGKQPAEAAQLLNDLSLRVGAVSETPTSSAPAGTIVAQKPVQGTALSPGGNVAFVVATTPDQSQVPDVVGTSQEVAETALVSARLLPWIVDSFSATVANGDVAAQLPAPGVELVPGTPVVLVVSGGPAPSTTIVPRLKGLTEAEATELLAANDLSGAFYRSFDASVPAGDVVSQSPPERTSAPYGSLVQVLVSQGPGRVSVAVPKVVGDSRKNAESKIKAVGLKPAVRTAPSPSVAKDRVISQMPPSGRLVAPGASVGIVVSTGPPSDAAVPSLASGASTSVTETIAAAGFEPVVLTVRIGGYGAGTVFAQYPQAGTPHPLGRPVVALIAAEP